MSVVTGPVAAEAGPRVAPTPYALVAATGTPMVSRTKHELLALSRGAETRPLTGGSRDLVLVTVQQARFWTPLTRQVYAQVASRGATVVVFGVGMRSDPTAARSRQVVTVPISADDPLAEEWNVLFLSGRSRHGFVARQQDGPVPAGKPGADMQRTFAWADVRDDAVLDEAAQTLLDRVPDLRLTLPGAAR
ncbi:MAG TPA: DICT sensory domain-containing protein [Actinomycetales bacterium]|jgi:DICT domain-containing protein